MATTYDGAAWLGSIEAVGLVSATAAAAATHPDPAAQAAALHAAAALLDAGAMRPDAPEAVRVVVEALALAAGASDDDETNPSTPGVAVEVSAGAAAALRAAGRVSAPALATGLAALVPPRASPTLLPPLALLEAACALGESEAGRSLLVRSGAAAAVGRAFAAWWGGDKEGQGGASPASYSLLLGSPRQRALDAVLILGRHEATLGAMGPSPAASSAALRAIAERLWLSRPLPPPRSAAVGAALAVSVAAGAADAGLAAELAAWVGLPARVVEGLAAASGGGDAGGDATARAARQCVAAWAALCPPAGRGGGGGGGGAPAVARAVGASPWAPALVSLLASTPHPAVRVAGVAGLGLAVRLGGCVHGPALARAAAAPLLLPSPPGGGGAPDDAGAAALDALADWLECEACPGLQAAAAAALGLGGGAAGACAGPPHPLLAAGLAPRARPALAAAAARVLTAAAGKLPGETAPSAAPWLPRLAAALAGRAGGEAAGALGGEAAEATAAALGAARAWAGRAGSPIPPPLATSLATSVVAILACPAACGPVVPAAAALAAVVGRHLQEGGKERAALDAAVVEAGGGAPPPRVNGDEGEDEDDALYSRLRLLALVGEPVGGVAPVLECV